MPFFSAEDLIEAVMERPALWDANDIGYSDRFVTKTMWNQIKRLSRAESITSLRKKWKNLRDQYRKELKKMRSGSENGTTWKHYDMMSFMENQIKSSRGESNTDTAELSEDKDKIHLIPHTSARASSVTPSEASSTVNTKRKITHDLKVEFLKIQKKKLILHEKLQREKRRRELLRTKESKDEDYHYLMTLLPQMRKFTPSQKFRVRNSINSVMLDEIECQGQLMDSFS